jgi:hypothetical protein
MKILAKETESAAGFQEQRFFRKMDTCKNGRKMLVSWLGE